MYKIPVYKVKLVKDGSFQDTLGTPDVCADMFKKLIGEILHEEVWCLFVNSKTRITGAVKLGQGGAGACGLLVADILRPGIVAGARAIILGHNHPSGDTTPSYEDTSLTNAVIKACDLVGMPLLDHIVVSTLYDTKHTSMRDACSCFFK